MSKYRPPTKRKKTKSIKMNTKKILNFLSSLIDNNNREWFNANKELYLECKADFELFVDQYITRMSVLDPSLQGLTAKDCEWRIYRDTRFSADKTPYKDHFGAFLAPHGGKKSPYGGYYVHLTPGGCMFAAGIWGPEKDLLHSLRMSVLDNYDELEAIMGDEHFRRYFRDFDTYYQLSRTPLGFPRDFVHDEWLRLRAFTVTCPLSDTEVCAPDFLDKLLDISAAVKPLNDFLNYSVDELYDR